MLVSHMLVVIRTALLFKYFYTTRQYKDIVARPKHVHSIKKRPVIMNVIEMQRLLAIALQTKVPYRKFAFVS